MSRHWVIWSAIGGLLLTQNIQAQPATPPAKEVRLSDWRGLMDLLKQGRDQEVETTLQAEPAERRAQIFWTAWQREHAGASAGSDARAELSDYMVRKDFVKLDMLTGRTSQERMPIAAWWAHNYPAHFDAGHVDYLLDPYTRYDLAMNSPRFAYAMEHLSESQRTAAGEALIRRYHPDPNILKNIDTSKMTDAVRGIHKMVVGKVSGTPGKIMQHAEIGKKK